MIRSIENFWAIKFWAIKLPKFFFFFFGAIKLPKKSMWAKRSSTSPKNLGSIGPVVPEIQLVKEGYPNFPIFGNFTINTFTDFKI